jgi:hypothetical protein
MEELKKIYKTDGTKAILEGLEEKVQKNYKFLNWN